MKDTVKAAIAAFRTETLGFIKSKSAAIATLAKALLKAGLSQDEARKAVKAEVEAVNTAAFLKSAGLTAGEAKEYTAVYNKVDVSRGLAEAGFKKLRAATKAPSTKTPAERFYGIAKAFADKNSVKVVVILEAALKLAKSEK